jgi:hypothetical protein
MEKCPGLLIINNRARKCFMISWENCAGFKGTHFICLESMTTFPGSCGVTFGYNGGNTGIGARQIFWSIVNSVDPSLCPPDFPFYADQTNGEKCWEYSIKYDCLNGNCVDSDVYKTPGNYATLVEYQANCGSSNNNNNSCNPPFQCIDPTNFCPPDKICVPQDEWSQILGLLARNKAKHCR